MNISTSYGNFQCACLIGISILLCPKLNYWFSPCKNHSSYSLLHLIYNKRCTRPFTSFEMYPLSDYFSPFAPLPPWSKLPYLLPRYLLQPPMLLASQFLSLIPCNLILIKLLNWDFKNLKQIVSFLCSKFDGNSTVTLPIGKSKPLYIGTMLYIIWPKIKIKKKGGGNMRST